MLVENNSFPEDVRVKREAKTLAGAGYQVTVISPTGTRSRRWHELIGDVSVYRFPAPPESDGFLDYVCEYTYTLAAMFLLSIVVFLREGFDIIHAANPPDTLAFIAAFYKLLGKRFIYDHHDLAPEMYYARFEGNGSRVIYGALVALEKLSCRLADRVITTNHSYKAMEIQRGKVPDDRITVVRNAPDLECPQVEPDLELRSRAGTIIAYIGVMGMQDGVDYLLRALWHLVHKLGRTDFLCVLIGGYGSARSSLKQLSSQLGLQRHVLFTNWVTDHDLRRYLSSADICVDPDPSNAFNDRSTMTKMMEYMALAKPIVAFDLPEHRFTARDAAIYVRPNDELEFARAIAQLMDDPERRRQMGEGGRRRIESELTWEYSATQLLRAYRSLLTEPERTSTSHTVLNERNWFRRRSTAYVANRSVALLRRYGVTSHRAKRRIRACVRILAGHQCRPTFAVPGRVLARHAEFCRELQDMGAEFAVHGHDHMDFRVLTREEVARQLTRATRSFRDAGIPFTGLRCPYLSATSDLLRSLPPDLFRYSSNKAIGWNVAGNGNGSRSTAVFETLNNFYQAEPSERSVAVPSERDGVLELPASVPDDIQLRDGLKLSPKEMAKAWTAILHDVHRRGEMFIVLFHTELFEECAPAFEDLLRTAKLLRPAMWITQLRDVSAWWRQRSKSSAHVQSTSSGAKIQFHCPDRATILIRNLNTTAPAHQWSERDKVLESRTLELDGEMLPLLGLSPSMPPSTAAFLKEQGYWTETGELALRCSLFLDERVITNMSHVELLSYIDASEAPLLRLWRWPDEARGTLCLTGDLDALSLADYAARLFA